MMVMHRENPTSNAIYAKGLIICGPGSILALYHMWVEFVVGSYLAPLVFLMGTPVFFPLQVPIRSIL